jgi:integrase/recombinase XerD
MTEKIDIPPIRLVEIKHGAIVPPSPGLPAPPADLRQTRVEEFFNSRQLAENTQRSYQQQFDRFLHWTDKAWQDVTHRDVLRYKVELEKQGLSPASVALALVALKSLFKWLKKLGYVNPTTAIEIPKNTKDESKALSDEQVQALYGALAERKRTRLRDTALLAVLSHGLRASEVVGLNVGDYDGRRLHIRAAKDGSTGRVPLDADARGAIETYLEWREEQGELIDKDAPMFLNQSFNPRFRGQGEDRSIEHQNRLSYRGIYNMVKELGRVAQAKLLEHGRAIEAAQLKQVHPHQLRHTYASNLVLGGMDAYLAMALTRHKSIAVFQRYSNQARTRKAELEFYRMRGELLPTDSAGQEE